MKKYQLFVSMAVASIVILTACAAPAAPTPAAPPPVAATVAPTLPPTPAPSPSPTPTFAPMTVKFGYLGGISDSAIDIAQAKGYFKEQGLTVELVPFASATEMTAPLGTDELQAGGGTISAGLFNAMGRGITVVIAADKGNYAPGFGASAILVRTALMDTIKGPKDLKGRSIALAARDSAAEMNLDSYLRTGGLTIADVNVVVIGFNDMLAALRNGAVDAAQANEPSLSRILSAGVARVLVRSDQVSPGIQIAVVLFSEKFAAKREPSTRFMVAYVKAARLYNDAFVKKDAATRKEVIEILSKSTKLDADLFDTMTMPMINADGKVNANSIDEVQTWLVAKGTQRAKIPMNQAVNNSFAEEAALRLGPYK